VVWKICLPSVTWSFTAVTRHYSFFHPRQISMDGFNMILLIGLFKMYLVFSNLYFRVLLIMDEFISVPVLQFFLYSGVFIVSTHLHVWRVHNLINISI
jgi:hypothetical protein